MNSDETFLIYILIRRPDPEIIKASITVDVLEVFGDEDHIEVMNTPAGREAISALLPPVLEGEVVLVEPLFCHYNRGRQ